ncbi:glycoside hydrolase family 97 catalytic domain-containing protein [Pseudoalteromonas sp. 68 DY56-GL68]|uniref:glycoside hydrolase family 97 protein n=1 Tax=Pseudoalteromonas sp. 68 DY56-GL68 TaxID=2974919 RepID=UPI00352A8D67
MSKIIACLTLVFTSLHALASLPISLTSPDNKLKLTVKQKQGAPYYSVTYNNILFLEDSPLGLDSSIGNFTDNLKFLAHETRQIEERYEMNNAKISKVHYQANKLITHFKNNENDEIAIEFNVSNNNIAFRYTLKANQQATRVKVLSEATGFNLPDDATTFITPQALPETGWMQTKPSYEEPYTFNEPVGIKSSNGVGYTFPALFKNTNKGWLLISETGVDSHYVGSKLSEGTKDGLYTVSFPQQGENNGIGETYAAMALPAATPWRTITLGKSLKPIVETTISYDVVQPRYHATQDYKMGRATWSWIVWQDESINFKDQVKFIDLASELGFEYVLVDNWWDQRIGREKIAELVNYANTKNIGIILWYNSNGWWNDAPQTPQNKMNTAPARQNEMAWLQDIGVKGLKVDFFGGDKQETIKLYEDIFTDANQYGLIITVHGSTLPRGWERMYPNFVTSEAVLASENLVFHQNSLDQHAYNATILPFTRNTVAAMDFAPVFLNKHLSRDNSSGTKRSTTDTFELATGVLYQSPVQHFGITPNNLDEQPEYVIEVLKKMPTVWDDTQYISGEPGTHAVLARKKGDSWYITAVNGEKKSKDLTISLPMLSGKSATLLFDNKDGSTGKKPVKIPLSGKVTLSLLSEGGALLISE